ncbi:hydroxymyristoyl-ACP dehydratase [Marinigracilibium pacificum]|uniref:Hydroxymyristoyl-ACP dehydratase n=1 Tax=Marinigracilibium pacificum TaxID=2729599 RepID=A0A848IU51_9BACT|nr:hydroxymyristoyl-ACP dehydratase [Marinigracilibium pacificum]NMM47867.1 hydroxymyristoyl-ACP dehydratase [Marinigracilibium pacificum]
MKAILQGTELFDYIPQRPPFVMVDKLYEKGDNYVVSGLTVSDDNLLFENGSLCEGGIVENIAQTAALFAGVTHKDLGKEVPLGFIAGIKNLKIFNKPLLGTELFTSTTLTNELNNIQIVNGEVKGAAGNLIASCELRIFIKES